MWQPIQLVELIYVEDKETTMKRYLLAAGLLCLQLLTAVATANDGPPKAPFCESLLPPEVKAKVEAAYTGWRVLEHNQLYPHQQEIWGARCPGVAIGEFRGPGKVGYGVVIVRQVKEIKQAKLLLLEKLQTNYTMQQLREQNEVPSYPVIHKEPPGIYREFYDRQNTVKVLSDVLVYEHLEATATLFYFKDGKYQELLISD